MSKTKKATKVVLSGIWALLHRVRENLVSRKWTCGNDILIEYPVSYKQNNNALTVLKIS